LKINDVPIILKTLINKKVKFILKNTKALKHVSIVVNLLFFLFLFLGACLASPPTHLQELDELAYKSPLEALDQIEQLKQASVVENEVMWLDVLRAKALYHSNQFSESQKLLIRIESTIENLKLPAIKEMMYRLMGQNFYRMGGIDQAMSYALKAQSISQSNALLWEHAQTTNLIAAIHMRSGEHQQALSFFKQSLTYFESISSEHDIAKLKNNLGALYIEVEDFDTAEQFLNESRGLAIKLGRLTTLISVLVNQIELYVNTDLFEQAEATYELCQQQAANSELIRFAVWCLEAGAEMSQAKGDYGQGIRVAQKAYLMASDQNLQQSQLNMGKLLVELYKQNRQLEQALNISTENLTQVESIKDGILKLKLEEASALHNVEQTQALLKLERAENELFKNKQRVIQIGIAVLVPVFILVLWLLRRRTQLVHALTAQQRQTQHALKEAERARQINEQLAQTDALTGLFNRRAMHQKMKDHYSKCKDKAQFHMMMIDVDDFKAINDNHGHAIGDMVLVEIAQIIKNVVPEECLKCRWGGEEFLLCLPGYNTNEVTELAHQLIHQVASLKFSENSDWAITISIGMSTASLSENLNQCIQKADQNLYTSKNNGKNQLTADF
jgi:diguanylate cyclase (GGDEF)-like protein